MPESIYRRKPSPDPTKVLTDRSDLIKLSRHNTETGTSAQVRDPAYISITGHCNKCGGGKSMTLAMNQTTWDRVYTPGHHFKIGPILEGVTIETAGDFMMARKLTGTIRCFKPSDFQDVIDAFLLPGNTITAIFSHKVKWGIGSRGTVKDYRVATFNFNTTSEGHWLCNFTAVSAAVSLKTVDIQIKIRSDKLDYYEAGEIEEKNRHKALSIAQLIASDAMVNGNISNDAFKDDYLITTFDDYLPGIELPNGAKPAIKLFTGDYLSGGTSGFSRGWSQTERPTDEVDKTTNQIYVTLGYIINRIINDQILGAKLNGIGSPDKEVFSKLKIRFDKILSRSKITPLIKSGDPISVLLHGPAGYFGARGDYRNSSKPPQGKNFEEKIHEPVSVSGDDFVYTWNILINRNVVNQAYIDSIKEKEAKADSTSLQVQKEEVVNLSDFLDKIFRAISDAMGGAINLALIEDPEDSHHLLVIDQNFGVSEQIPCFVFNPIDGDGSTRNCQIDSNVGSSEYKSTMYMGISKRGDPVTQLRKCTDVMEDARKKEYVKAGIAYIELVQIPGHLAKNYYNATDIQGLKSIMGSAYHNRPQAQKDEAIHFPGMRITIDLDGVWGFQPGNAISSTQLPSGWRDKNVYFMVTNVLHTFANNDWQTTLTGIMTYYDNLKIINL